MYTLRGCMASAGRQLPARTRTGLHSADCVLWYGMYAGLGENRAASHQPTGVTEGTGEKGEEVSPLSHTLLLICSLFFSSSHSLLGKLYLSFFGTPGLPRLHRDPCAPLVRGPWHRSAATSLTGFVCKELSARGRRRAIS